MIIMYLGCTIGNGLTLSLWKR